MGDSGKDSQGDEKKTEDEKNCLSPIFSGARWSLNNHMMGA